MLIRPSPAFGRPLTSNPFPSSVIVSATLDGPPVKSTQMWPASLCFDGVPQRLLRDSEYAQRDVLIDLRRYVAMAEGNRQVRR